MIESPDGSSVYFSYSRPVGLAPMLSPDNEHVAVFEGAQYGGTTLLFHQSSLINTLDARPTGWLDANRLLTVTFASVSRVNPYWYVDETPVFDAAGQQVDDVGRIELLGPGADDGRQFYMVSPSRIFVRYLILDLETCPHGARGSTCSTARWCRQGRLQRWPCGALRDAQLARSGSFPDAAGVTPAVRTRPVTERCEMLAASNSSLV